MPFGPTPPLRARRRQARTEDDVGGLSQLPRRIPPLQTIIDEFLRVRAALFLAIDGVT